MRDTRQIDELKDCNADSSLPLIIQGQCGESLSRWYPQSEVWLWVERKMITSTILNVEKLILKEWYFNYQVKED